MKYLVTESQLNLITEGLDFDEVYKKTHPIVFREVCMKMAKNLIKAIENLPEGYKTILLLYYFSGMKHNKIAELLGIDSGTSRSQLAKARESLRKSVGKYLNQN